MDDDLISRRALYERATTLEAQALDYVGKLIERDGEETSVEWRIWSAILIERTAFKHDVYDAPSVQPNRKNGKWEVYVISPFDGEDVRCSECGQCGCAPYWDYCPNCGAKMEVESDGGNS